MFNVHDHIITTTYLYPIQPNTPAIILQTQLEEATDPLLYTNHYYTRFLIDTGTMTTWCSQDDITIDKQYYRDIKISQILQE